jgi:hypothetical protein
MKWYEIYNKWKDSEWSEMDIPRFQQDISENGFESSDFESLIEILETNDHMNPVEKKEKQWFRLAIDLYNDKKVLSGNFMQQI